MHQKQFTNDLSKFSEPGTLKWIFNKKGANQSLEELQKNVLKSLRKTDGSPIDELADVLDEEGILSDLAKALKVESGIMDAEDFLQILEEPDTFAKIFEMVE